MSAHGHQATDVGATDRVLVDRVKEEHLELRAVSDPSDDTRLDRFLTPFNPHRIQALPEGATSQALGPHHRLALARGEGPQADEACLRELELLCRGKVTDLLRPGRVLLRLGVTCFG